MVTALYTAALARAEARQLPILELFSITAQLTAGNAGTLARELYRTWIAHNPDDSAICAAYFNLAGLLTDAEELEEAYSALTESIRINPDFYPPYINVGRVLERMGRVGDAVNNWYALINRLHAVNGENIRYKVMALKQVGRVLEGAQLDENAEAALYTCIDISPGQDDAIQHWFSLRQRQCKWPAVQPWGELSRDDLVAGSSALSLSAHTDDPFLLLAIAHRFYKTMIGEPSTNFLDTHEAKKGQPRAARRKVGYLSSDLREHAIGFLMSELFELHDRSRVEVFLYYCGHKVTDSTQERIIAAAEHWVDISPMSDAVAAQRMIDDGIEILIDVNGYTHSARTKLLAMRPAPIIVNWLGFPGSAGSPYHHYIIADDFIIPPENEIFYSEKVLRLPCYQPNDRKRVVAPERPTRASVGLPEDAMVYCSFNGIHKITSFTWRRWMQILQGVPGSVLWLLSGTVEATHKRLREAASDQGVDPARIVFAKKIYNPHHLARYPLADLFLDTSPYGAHTTSSDAMWMGVPIITLVGRSFSSRVCGSLVKSAGMDDLVCISPDDYVAKAIALGSDRDRLAKIRERLIANRDSCVLFNTPLLASKLEDLFEQMWTEYKAGKLPRPDLSNLEVYGEIGVSLFDENIELLTVPNYLDIYRQKLAERDKLSYLRADDRLWPGGSRVEKSVTPRKRKKSE